MSTNTNSRFTTTIIIDIINHDASTPQALYSTNHEEAEEHSLLEFNIVFFKILIQMLIIIISR